MKDGNTTIPLRQNQKKRLEHIKEQLSLQWGRCATFGDVMEHLLRGHQ